MLDFLSIAYISPSKISASIIVGVTWDAVPILSGMVVDGSDKNKVAPRDEKVPVTFGPSLSPI